ncbi:MAG: von Willebrand factor type A domain-containing protein [Chitinophagaceae bacterium]|nr:von Willebrand factor type A domain-containing protein [Chitinophagaceae bacterium]
MQKIFLFAIVAIFALLAFTSPKDLIVTGTVTDQSGNPIPFATIKVVGTRTGLSADQNGHFSINVKSEQSELEISAAGFKNAVVRINGQKNITVVMEKSGAELKEVVVTAAYGTKRQARSTSTSVQNISSQQLYGVRSVNVNQALAGKVSGVQIRSQSAIALGRENTIRLRGENGLGNRTNEEFDREGYDYITENDFLKTNDNPLSTFSIDVDAASYSNLRRFLKDGQMPPAGAVRIEEMVNYFKYEYPQPKAADPFSVNTEISACPWNPDHRLALIGLQGKIIPTENLPSGNIVFLIDVSGSMSSEDKLPLLKQSLKLLVDQLRENDKVSLCVYAGNAGLVLPATNGLQKQKIKDAIDALESGGSTAGGQGIMLAYKTAKDNFIPGGNNRVILCTDGDFNVGVSSDDELVRLIEKERESGVFLTVLGFGTGNYQDAKMQKLADKGNGNHAYIDQLSEAKKVLVSEFGGTLFTIAKDVKLQIEFNPALVQGYRLIGYENRMLNKEDFNDDKKDAGEMGSGHTVTALYEIIPVGIASGFLKKVDTLKYQPVEKFSNSKFNQELMTVKLRYKEPDGKVSKLMEVPVSDRDLPLQSTSANFRFASSVAAFGMLLRNSSFKQQSSFKMVNSLASNALGPDTEGYRKEFVQLVQKATALAKKVRPDQSE